MEKLERIEHEGKIYAIIIRSEHEVDGVKFYTPEDYPFQMGVHLREKGEEIEAHIHNPTPRTITTTQEMIHVDYGTLGVDFYDAFAYAAWVGKRLPTGDEWELAARGQTKNLVPIIQVFEITSKIACMYRVSQKLRHVKSPGVCCPPGPAKYRRDTSN